MKLLGSLLFLLPFTIQAAPSIGLSPSQNMVTVGTGFTVDLLISGLGDHMAPSLAGFDVNISFDDSVLGLTGISFTDALGNQALGESLSDFSSLIPGSVNLYQVSFLEDSQANCIFCIDPLLEDLQGGSMTLATLTFNALAVGSTDLELLVNVLSNGIGDEIFADSSSAMVSVAAVPLPAAIWLFIGTLPVFGFAKSRSRSSV